MNYLTANLWSFHLSKDTTTGLQNFRAGMIIKCPGWFLDEQQVLIAALLSWRRDDLREMTGQRNQIWPGESREQSDVCCNFQHKD